MAEQALFIGLMSGTSLDGVDAALVAFNSDSPQVIATHFSPYPQAVRASVLALQYPANNELETSALLANTLAKLYAEAVHGLLAKAHKTAADITAIGCHGQTIRHRPELGFTLQVGNAALLAELTNITVVSDFRSRDVAAGGQGAPLVPAFHRAVFASSTQHRAIVNIGGIANITYLAANHSQAVLGFDSGAGNMLLDCWIKQHRQLDYDANGAWASSGKLIQPLLDLMLADPFLSIPPPKSTGRDLFNPAWLAHVLSVYTKLVPKHAPNNVSNANITPQDVAHTLVAFTAQSIAKALVEYCNAVDAVYICGGGAHNQLLMAHLKQALPNVEIHLTDSLGIAVDWVEAIAFAWLAKQCLSQKPANIPEVTGANGAKILGAIYQR